MAIKSEHVKSEQNRLKRRLERERSARLQAEAIAEKSLRELYEKQKELLFLQEIAVAANEASTINGAMKFAVDRVCAYTGWPVGHVYIAAMSLGKILIPTTIWHLERQEQFETFRKITEATQLPPGIGLAGRVLAAGKPVWITDVTQDSSFLRAKRAEDIGVRAGFAFPVLVGTEVVAVLEFFSDEALEPDERLLEVMTQIGTQIGRVIERNRAEGSRWKVQEELETRVKERTVELERANEVLRAEIAERNRAEEALRESEEKNRTIIEYTYDFICETSIDGRFLYVNPKHKDMLNYEPRELVGRSVFEFIHPDDLSHVMAEFQRAAVNRTSGHAIYRFRHKNGLWRWFESTGKPFRTATGELRAIIASHDITERKQAEETQAQLLRELESTNQELKDFAYVVSHDLKAPLRAISSLASWIASDYSDKFDETGKEQLGLLLGRARRMHNLIDGILQYSRLGRMREERVRVNLNELLAEVADTIAPPGNIEIKVENDLPIILCDRTRIEQVFQNLLSNAVKFMDKDSGEIKIGCVEENGFWKFHVYDNGPGIEERYFEKIFQIFQTLAPRDESENTGVGLAVVKKIIEVYGGRIWVESRIGSGTTFFFTLPKHTFGHFVSF